ncbi:MAG: hypothetical protein IJU75_05875 [Clostridia bacterium]|nr:hypothetical protein [Clostridia bacterium]
MKKIISLLIASIMLFAAVSLCVSADEPTVPLMQPEPGEFELELYGRTNGFAQQPKITDNGDGTFSVDSKDGNGVPKDWYENYIDNQYTDQNGQVGDVNVTWNNYFPRVFYKDGVRAEELHWGLISFNDITDVLDFEVYYSDDTVTWKKADVATIAKYSPSSAGPDYTQEFDQNCSSGLGFRFIFAEPIEAKFFFLYDPDPEYANLFCCSAFFCAANKAAVETEPATQATEAKTDKPADTTAKPADGTQAPVGTQQTSEPAKNNTGLIIGIIAAVVVVAAVVAVVAVKSKKK